jgi:alkanesulfonate monooxygenase SsuD/methylene tetrahydromethanopterin reductase-like flavin-dependent oxidoreductase (luciferase family)
VGDGWHPTGLSPEDFAIGREEVAQLATAAGRDQSSITMSARIEVEVHGGPSSQRAASRARLPGDDPGAMRAGIEAYREAGVEHVVLALNSGDIPSLRRLMSVIADEVLPSFR